MSGKKVHVAIRSQHPIWSAAGRFAFGLPVWGEWQSDADWFAHGQKPLGRRAPRELAGLRLGYRPGYQRMVFRWTCTAEAGYVAVGGLTHPWDVGANTALGVAAVGSAYGYKAWLAHQNQTSEPARNALQLQLAKLLDTPFADAKVTRDGTVTVELPKEFILAEGSAKSLVDIVQRTMGEELEVAWPNLLKTRTVTLSRVPEPPDEVKYDAIREALLALPNGRLYLGADSRGRAIVTDLDTDSPHIALSMRTGRGKSTLYRLLLSQLTEQGCDTDVIDMKRISLHEFVGVPGIVIHRDEQDCWDTIETFFQEVGERYRILEDLTMDEWPAKMAQWRRRTLLIEELNAFRELSQQYWDKIRTSKDRAQPPVFGTLSLILNMARQVRMHVMIASQRFEARTIGGGANRDQFGLRILANPTRADWAMLGEGKKPRGVFSRRAGRVAAVVAGEPTVLQVGHLSYVEAKAHATTRRDIDSLVTPSYVETVQGNSQTVSYDIAALMTLRDYSEKHGVSLAALRQAVHRAGMVSHGTDRGALLYRPDDLRDLQKGGGEHSTYDPSGVVADVD